MNQGVGQNVAANQRAATYMVISKPKRKSAAAGVVQIMLSLLQVDVVAG
jgi:hypothetical protein